MIEKKVLIISTTWYDEERLAEVIRE